MTPMNEELPSAVNIAPWTSVLGCEGSPFRSQIWQTSAPLSRDTLYPVASRAPRTDSDADWSFKGPTCSTLAPLARADSARAAITTIEGRVLRITKSVSENNFVTRTATACCQHRLSPQLGFDTAIRLLPGEATDESAALFAQSPRYSKPWSVVLIDKSNRRHGMGCLCKRRIKGLFVTAQMVFGTQ